MAKCKISHFKQHLPVKQSHGKLEAGHYVVFHYLCPGSELTRIPGTGSPDPFAGQYDPESG